MVEPDDAAIEAQLAEITPERWAAIAAALAAVEAEGRFTNGWSSTEPKFPGDTHHFPYPLYTDAVEGLIRTLGQRDLIVHFTWMEWPGFLENWPAERFVAGPVADSARLITNAIRGERFSDGFIEALLEKGILQAAIRRLLAARPTPS